MPEERDGNLGTGLLKRFIVTFNYQNSEIFLAPSPAFDDPYEYDMSGLEYYGTGEGYKHIIVSRVESGSPADDIGLEAGDEITAINFKSVLDMTLEQVDNMFKSKDGRNLLIVVFHDHRYDRVILTLKRRI